VGLFGAPVVQAEVRLGGRQPLLAAEILRPLLFPQSISEIDIAGQLIAALRDFVHVDNSLANKRKGSSDVPIHAHYPRLTTITNNACNFKDRPVGISGGEIHYLG